MQTLRKEKWIEARNEDSFQCVFPCGLHPPSELNPLVSMNARSCTIFFSVSLRNSQGTPQTTRNISGGDREYRILHTGAEPMDHPHIIVLSPADSPPTEAAGRIPQKVFHPLRVMSALFKGKFLIFLEMLQIGCLRFPDRINHPLAA